MVGAMERGGAMTMSGVRFGMSWKETSRRPSPSVFALHCRQADRHACIEQWYSELVTVS